MIRGKSLLSASMDNFFSDASDHFEVYNSDLEKSRNMDETTASDFSGRGSSDRSLNNLRQSSIDEKKLTLLKSKEPLMFDPETESLGVSQILQALSPEEVSNMSDPNLPLRHFRADKGNIQKAISRTKYAIKWRLDFGVDKIIKAVHDPVARESNPELQKLRDIIRHESSPGKMYVRNRDKEGRAILYMYPVRENTNHLSNNIINLVYAIERAIAVTEKNGFEKIVIIMDFKNWSLKHAAPMETTKKTIHILQDCYVERLSRVFFTNAPVMFRTFWNMAKPFIDPVTKRKIVFCSSKAGMEELRKQFDQTKVEKSALGEVDLRPFDVDEYLSTPLHISFDEIN